MKILEKSVFIVFAVLPITAIGQEQIKTIVFVCEHGGARSAIASAYFNKMAIEKNLPYRSVFRGLKPDPRISNETKEGLKKDGFNVDQFLPSALSQNDILPETLLISLDCTVPAEFKTYQEWAGIPAISDNYYAAREEIVKLLNSLIKDLYKKDLRPKN